MLLAGGSTAIPRWTLDPVPGVAEHERRSPTTSWRRCAGWPTSWRCRSARCCWPRTPRCWPRCPASGRWSTGYVAGPGGRPLPCRLTTEPAPGGRAAGRRVGSSRSCWRTRTSRSTTSRRELGLTGPAFETVFDPAGARRRPRRGHRAAGGLRASAAAGSRCGCGTGPRCSTPAAPPRIAGYHLTALALIAADPDAEHGRQSLLSAEELRFQLDGLAGPRRELPDRRFHELFEQRVRAHPDAVAAVHGDRQWTYRELNARANRLAPGAAGAGAAPRGRRRRGDRAQPGLDGRRPRGLQGRRRVPADRAALPGRSDRDHARPRRVPAGADRARQHHHARPGPRHAARRPDAPRRRRPARRATPTATSASPSRRTSSPTSTSPPAPPASPRARCASTRACSTTSTPRSTTWRSARAQVVAQTAPQCFDISLWQLVSALLVGGRTLIVEQEVILDVERFVDTIVDGRVAVLQVVPSYLEVVLSYLEQHPRDAARPALRVGHRRGAEEGARAALVRGRARDQAGQRLRADRDLRRHQPRGHGPGARPRPGPARPPGPQRARLRRRRAPVTGAARRPRRDRLLRRLRRPRVRQRSRAHPAGLPGRSAPRRASGSTAAATTAAGCPTASWSSSAAGTPRSRSAASGSRSARSRTRCCGCPASATARSWSPSGPTTASTWWPSTPASGRSTADVLRDRLARVAARVHGSVGLPLARTACR